MPRRIYHSRRVGSHDSTEVKTHFCVFCPPAVSSGLGGRKKASRTGHSFARPTVSPRRNGGLPRQPGILIGFGFIIETPLLPCLGYKKFALIRNFSLLRQGQDSSHKHLWPTLRWSRSRRRNRHGHCQDLFVGGVCAAGRLYCRTSAHRTVSFCASISIHACGF